MEPGGGGGLTSRHRVKAFLASWVAWAPFCDPRYETSATASFMPCCINKISVECIIS